jgi:imidazolonepropionase-like amidohydrolase
MRHLALVPLLAAPLAAPPLVAQDNVVAFTNVTVIPMDRERVLRDQTVVVRGDRIAEIGAAGSLRVPGGATVVDGRGKYLLPGVAEMHAHIPSPQNPEFQERVLFLYLAGGVTTIRGMLGNPQHLELRERAARGAIWSPTIYTSGPSLNGNSAPTPEAARRMVEEQRAAGYDFLKIHPGLSRAAFDTMAQTAQRVGIRFSGHVPARVGLERALEARYATIDHLDGFAEWLAGVSPGDTTAVGFFGLRVADRIDQSRIPDIVRRTREAGVWVVPTQTLLETVTSAESPEEVAARPGSRYLPQSVLQAWMNGVRSWRGQNPVTPEAASRYQAARRRLLRELSTSGAGVLLGSDAPQVGNVPGFSIHRELETYVASGLSPWQALETGTRNVARFFGAEREFGTIEAGKRADLVLLEADPLADIRNFARQAGVMVRGRWLSAEEIRRRLDRYLSTQ